MITESGGATDRLDGVILGYELRTSAPPAFPDFIDVPTSSPQFRFIEVLSNSGITVGCGEGDYCPDALLACGHIATFFAKELRL